MLRSRSFAPLAVGLLIGAIGLAHPVGAQTASVDSSAIVTVVQAFHAALERGDSAAVIALLAPRAVILESGSAETVAEYRSHHLPADIEFARAVPGVRTPLRITVRGDFAWAAATGITQGEFKGRAVNSASAELLVLERLAGAWRITAIHWSSRRRN